MSSNPTCPAATVLEKLLKGSLSEGQQAQLGSHLETCTACQKRLQQLAAGTGSWTAAAANLGGLIQSKVSRPASTQPDGMSALAGATKGGKTTFEFLEPPVKPRQLGKLAHYEIIEVVGQGGMGIVFKALDPGLHRLVAVKVMAPQLAAVASARQRFSREARAAAAVCHEHVVTIHAVDEARGLPYLVMQFVGGVSLQERFDQRGPLNLDEILRIGMQTAQGLAAAHKQGLVHRDVKPANILLENGVERVKLTDFGLARIGSDAQLTQSGVVVGTPQYMAPEQADGKPVDHRADLFSLGSVLYFMCTGQPPFQGDSSLAVLRQVCEKSAPPVRELNPNIPEWLARIIARLQAKNPDERFQSAAEVAQLLGKYLTRLQEKKSILPVPAPPAAKKARTVRPPAVPKPNKSARPVKKSAWSRPLVLSGAAVLLLGCVGLIVGAIIHFSGKRDRDPVVQREGTQQQPPGDPAPKQQPIPPISPIKPIEPIKAIPPITQAEPERKPAEPERKPAEPEPKPAEPPTKVVAAATPIFPRLAAEPIVLRGHNDAVWSVAFSPDSKQLASGGKDHKLRLWDLSTHKETDSTGVFVAHLEGMVYSKDGSTLLIADGPAIRMRNNATRKIKILDQGANSPNRALTWIHALALSPDGNTLAVGYTDHYYDDTARPVALWDLRTSKIRTTLNRDRLGKGVYSLAYSPDGTRLATSSGNDVRIWDTHNDKQIALCTGNNGRVRALAYSPDGKLLATASFDKTVRLWDGKTGEEVIVLEGHTNRVHALAFSPDGHTLASGSADGSIRFWDVPSGKLQGSLDAKPTEGGTLAFSPDGKWFAAGCLDKTVKLWSIGAKPTAIVESLPPDLDRIPRDVPGFVSIRVADTLNRPVAAAARKLVNEHKLVQMYSRLFDMRVGDIERVVLVLLPLPQRRAAMQQTRVVALLTTSRPYDRERFLSFFAPEKEEKKAGSATYFAGKKPPGTAVCFLNERTVILGTADDVRSFLEQPIGKDKKGPLHAALSAAAGKESLVVGLRPEQLESWLKPSAPRNGPLPLALLRARTGLLRLDVGDELRLNAQLTFADERQAAEGKKELENNLAGAALLLQQFRMGLRMNAPPALAPLLPKVAGLLDAAGKAVVENRPQQQGVAVTYQMRLKSPDWLSVALEAAPALALGPARAPGQTPPPSRKTPGQTAPASPKTPEEAEAAIKKLGGEVERDKYTKGKPIVGVRLVSKKVTDADLVVLGPLSTLTTLSLVGLQITDRGLVHLKHLKELETLNLGGNDGITDAGLAQLKSLPKLKTLRLLGTRVSDKGAAEFKKARPDVKVVN